MEYSSRKENSGDVIVLPEYYMYYTENIKSVIIKEVKNSNRGVVEWVKVEYATMVQANVM